MSYRHAGKHSRQPGKRHKNRDDTLAPRKPQEQLPLHRQDSGFGPAVPLQGWPNDHSEIDASTGTWHHDVALVDGLAIKDTGLAQTLEVIGNRFPGYAGRLTHAFNNEVQASRDDFVRVIRAENARLDLQNRQARTLNAEIEAAIAALELRHREECTQLKTEIAEIGTALLERKLSAADTLSLAGGSFDPENLSDAVALQVRETSEAQAATEIGLPPAEIGAPLLYSSEWYFLSACVGALIGIGFAVTGGLLHADQLGRHWPITVAAALVGFAIATATKSALSRASAFAAAYRFSNLPQDFKASLVAVLGLFTIALGVDATVLRTGLLARNSTHAAAVAAASLTPAKLPVEPLGFAVVGLAVTLGFFALALTEGTRSGITGAVRQRASALAEQRRAKDEATRRADPLVRRGLSALGKVRVLKAHLAELRDELSEREDQLKTSVDDLQSRRLPLRDTWDAAGARRVKKSRRDFLGPVIDFRNELWHALLLAEPRPGYFWSSIFRWCFFARPRKR